METTIFSALAAVAASNPFGFTVAHDSLQPISHGFAVAVADTQNSFGEAGLRRVVEYVKKHAPAVNAFGGWLDQETGLYYWDATIVVETREEAERLTRENGQIAFFCLDTCEEVRL